MNPLRYRIADHFQGVVHQAGDWITAAAPLILALEFGYAWHGPATMAMLAPAGVLAGYTYLASQARAIRQAATRQGIPVTDYVAVAP